MRPYVLHLVALRLLVDSPDLYAIDVGAKALQELLVAARGKPNRVSTRKGKASDETVESSQSLCVVGSSGVGARPWRQLPPCLGSRGTLPGSVSPNENDGLLRHQVLVGSVGKGRNGGPTEDW
ncbi:hypothetical protein MPNT_60060 [Candidatus Methylacidithermus pantelleriae]|uniref:Uncharacterized protein n=1 Tax=Candidatus Methylacidithermus pantelleriae TaxID=2744239 RepID=A0A8J2FX76_9BACT|nr:hypothetical protein MPNT_60060 [Candidatus Methylacidithermus pantelleriae]